MAHATKKAEKTVGLQDVLRDMGGLNRNQVTQVVNYVRQQLNQQPQARQPLPDSLPGRVAGSIVRGIDKERKTDRSFLDGNRIFQIKESELWTITTAVERGRMERPKTEAPSPKKSLAQEILADLRRTGPRKRLPEIIPGKVEILSRTPKTQEEKEAEGYGRQADLDMARRKAEIKQMGNTALAQELVRRGMRAEVAAEAVWLYQRIQRGEGRGKTRVYGENETAVKAANAMAVQRGRYPADVTILKGSQIASLGNAVEKKVGYAMLGTTERKAAGLTATRMAPGMVELYAVNVTAIPGIPGGVAPVGREKGGMFRVLTRRRYDPGGNYDNVAAYVTRDRNAIIQERIGGKWVTTERRTLPPSDAEGTFIASEPTRVRVRRADLEKKV